MRTTNPRIDSGVVDVLRNYTYQKSEEYAQKLLKQLRQQKGELIFLLNHPGYYIGNLDKLLQENQAQKLLDNSTAIQVAEALKKYQKRQAEKRHKQELIKKQEEKRRRKQQQERKRQELEAAQKEWETKARAKQLQPLSLLSNADGSNLLVIFEAQFDFSR